MNPVTIIGIDDDWTARGVIATAADLLSQRLNRPVRVHVTHSGAEGLRLLHEQPSDSQVIVIFDLYLPDDVDGRLIGSYVREHFPGMALIPITGHRDRATAEVLRTSGLPKPALKPISAARLAARMVTALDEQDQPTDTTLQSFHAYLAGQMAGMARPASAPRPLRVALLAGSHIVLQGLKHTIAEIAQDVSLEVTEPSGRRDPVLVAMRQNLVDLLICDPGDIDEAKALAQANRTPLLVYASLPTARTALASGESFLVGPATTCEWTLATQTVVAGERYRPRHLEMLLSLTPRQARILKELLQGASTEQVAAKVSVSSHRLRHIISQLYDHLGVTHNRAALLMWAREAPVHLLDELAEL